MANHHTLIDNKVRSAVCSRRSAWERPRQKPVAPVPEVAGVAVHAQRLQVRRAPHVGAVLERIAVALCAVYPLVVVAQVLAALGR